jgi:hypothetical protein
MHKRLYKEQNRQLEIFSLWRKQSETPCKSILPPMFYNFFVKTAMLVGWRDHQIYTLMMAQAKFGSNWPSVFRGEHLQIINCCHLWIEVRVFGYNFGPNKATFSYQISWNINIRSILMKSITYGTHFAKTVCVCWFFYEDMQIKLVLAKKII